MVRYYKLFDLLNRRGMKKSDLREILSPKTVAKLSKGEYLSGEVIEKICLFLRCQPGDIMEIVETEQIDENLQVIKKSSDVFKYFYHLYQNKMQEELMVILLNTKNIVIDYKFVFKGSLNHSIVHPREIFKEAIYSSANAIIIIHNHPSGDVTPSEEDKKITEKIVLCGEMLNMPLLDHIIFGNNAYYSFLEEGNI